MKRKGLIAINDMCVATHMLNGYTIVTVCRPRRTVTVRHSGEWHSKRLSMVDSVDRKAAVIKAAKLAEGLGEGWEGRVWENCGWHASAVKAHCEVHDHRAADPCRYWADLNDYGGPQVQASGRTSREAVIKVVKQAQRLAVLLAQAAQDIS